MTFTPGQRVTIQGLADDNMYALVNGRTATVGEIRPLAVNVRLDVPITMDDVREILGPNGTMYDMADDGGYVISMARKFLAPVTVPTALIDFTDQGGPMC